MILKCKSCGGAMEFDAGAGLMFCPYCGTFAEKGDAYTEEVESKEESVSFDEENGEYMECNVYKCSSCAAELNVNGVESSTFCAYCGQPTIVFDRVSKTLKPHYIIPFSVSKEEAERLIRQRITAGFFVPSDLKDFKIDKLRGIYIPYWLFDMDYKDTVTVKGKVRHGKSTETKTFIRYGSCFFEKLTVDASYQLNDDVSQRLEPYLTNQLKTFDVGYMSGYYADKFDRSDGQMHGVGFSRAKELFNEEILKTCKASDLKIVESHPEYKFTKAEYALLPAWFLTLRYQNKPYTILVNGQTGKVNGAVPFSKIKTSIVFASVFALSIVPSVLVSKLGVDLMLSARNNSDDDREFIVFLIVSAVILLFVTGIKQFRRLLQRIGLSNASSITSFVGKRQQSDRGD